MFENNLIFKIADGCDSDPKVRIAKTAIGEFARFSLDGARIRQIAKNSDTNIAAINYHFGGKEGLYNTVIGDLSEYFEHEVSPYYSEGEAIERVLSAKDAKKLIKKFVLECIERFGREGIVKYLCLIMSREEVSPSKAFCSIYYSIYERPVNFLAKMLSIASGGRLKRDMSVVFAQSLWSSVRAYSAKSSAVMRLHNWRELGKKEMEILSRSLDKVIEKALR